MPGQYIKSFASLHFFFMSRYINGIGRPWRAQFRIKAITVGFIEHSLKKQFGKRKFLFLRI